MLRGLITTLEMLPWLTLSRNSEREVRMIDSAGDLARASLLRINKRRPIKGSSRILRKVNILEKVILRAFRISLRFFMSLTSTVNYLLIILYLMQFKSLTNEVI